MAFLGVVSLTFSENGLSMLPSLGLQPRQVSALPAELHRSAACMPEFNCAVHQQAAPDPKAHPLELDMKLVRPQLAIGFCQLVWLGSHG